MTHEELEDTIPLYAVGALERGERQATEAHLLSGCIPCHSALKEYQSVAAVLPFGLKIVTPPRTLKSQIMAARAPSVDQDTGGHQPGKQSLKPGEWMNHIIPPESSAPTYSFGWIIGLAVAVILAGGGYLAWTAYHAQVSEDTTRLTQLQNQAAAAGSKLAALQRQIDERDKSLAAMRAELDRRTLDLAEFKDQLIQREAELEVATVQLTQQGGQPTRLPQDELAALLRAPNTKGLVLAGTEMATRASGILLYDAKAHKTWFYALNLPESPNGMTYQLWAMRDQPISIGTFRIGAGETSHLFATPLPDGLSARTFSVRLESIGGSPQPTGPVYLLSRS